MSKGKRAQAEEELPTRNRNVCTNSRSLRGAPRVQLCRRKRAGLFWMQACGLGAGGHTPLCGTSQCQKGKKHGNCKHCNCEVSNSKHLGALPGELTSTSKTYNLRLRCHPRALCRARGELSCTNPSRSTETCLKNKTSGVQVLRQGQAKGTDVKVWKTDWKNT